MESHGNETGQPVLAPYGGSYMPADGELTVRKKNARKSYRIVALSLLLFLAVTYVLAYGVEFICSSIPWADRIGNVLGPNWDIYMQNLVAMYMIAFPISLLLAKLAPKASPRNVKLSFGRWIQLFIMGYPCVYLCAIFSNWLASVLTGGQATNYMAELMSEITPLALFVVAIAGPVVEELIFRKMMIDRTRQYGELIAILYSAFAFGIFHRNLYQFLYAFALGVIFGYVYVRTGRIRYTIEMHIVFNSFSTLLSTIISKGAGMEMLLKISQTMEASPEAARAIIENLTPEQAKSIVLLYACVLVMLLLVSAGTIIIILNFAGKKIYLLPAEQEMPKKSHAFAAFVNAGTILFTITCIVFMIISLFS